jgi:hypothetical protein
MDSALQAVNASKRASTLAVVCVAVVLSSLPAVLATTYYAKSKDNGNDPTYGWAFMGLFIMWLLVLAVASYGLAFCTLTVHYNMYVKSYQKTAAGAAGSLPSMPR